jgi:hypothetical protein
MNAGRLTLLSSSILTAFGEYRYEPLSREQARDLLAEFRATQKPIHSAIGHDATARLLSVLLNHPVEMNRAEFRQSPDDLGLVFKLKGRAPEGAILSRAEIEAMGYEFGLLTRLS